MANPNQHFADRFHQSPLRDVFSSSMQGPLAIRYPETVNFNPTVDRPGLEILLTEQSVFKHGFCHIKICRCLNLTVI